MKLSSTLLAATAALTLSCAHQKIPAKGFDPRATGPVTDGNFETINRPKKIDPAWLKPPTEPYRLGPGDLVEVEVAEVPGTLARTFVMPDGMVYYDLAGGVKAEGLTQMELAATLRKSLKRDYADPMVNVSLVEVRSRRYWMLGRVFKPGIFPLRQPTTLLEAISQSGGLFTSQFSGTTEELADLSSSVVIRDGSILPVDFQKLVKNGDTSQNIYLRHNDFVYLPSSQGGSVLLLGAVNEPKSVSFKDSLSLVQCLAYGRGPAEGAYMKKVVIVRGSRSKPQATTVDVQAIITGKATDVALKPGDIVWIPRNPFNLLSEGVELVFRDAARTIAANEGAAAAGSDQKSLITIPAGTPNTTGN
ncbi:MAG: polysaccharide export protein [Akkermansiaceae bacterium]|nr:polysaccharide export protein [Akkermansiaceae bacterium]